jgi:hypothetical protein
MKISKPTMPNSSASDQTEAPASTETIRERIEREISQNPRFKIVKPSGRGYVIGGAKPTK